MPGIKQFDRGEVLDRAMALFWRRGYEATSIRDLVAATGINRGSIYATFGDKEGLFLAVLDHYGEKFAKPLIQELEDPDPRRAIERMFDSIIRRNSDARFPRGCLNTNTSLECPGSGDEITRKIAAGFGRQESAIYRVLHRAQAEGSLRSTLDARALARFFMAVAQGLNVVNKAAADPGVLQDIARVAMSVWDTTDGTKPRTSKPRKQSKRAQR
jgi:TetR/AcrR family transcriptional regulator, transcriptional repressor for nem operon